MKAGWLWLATGLFFGCQVEAPQMDESQNKRVAAEEQQISLALHKRFEKTGPAIEVIRTLSSLSQGRGLESQTGTSSFELGGTSKLLDGDGMVTRYDEQSGYFEYNLASEAAFQLAADGKTLSLALTGYVEEIGDEVVVIQSELTAVYQHAGRTQRFRIMYEDSSEGNQAEVELHLNLEELLSLYAVMAEDEPSQEPSAIGTLTIRIGDDGTSIEGTDVAIYGSEYDVVFATMSFSFGSAAAAQRDVQIDGTIYDKGETQVGAIKIESKTEGDVGKLTVKVTFND